MKKILKKISFFPNFVKRVEKIHSDVSLACEDKPVLTFFGSLSKDKRYNYLEVASGRGRFLLLIKNKFVNFDVTCLEINHNLAALTSGLGLKTIEKDILKNELTSESFDIVHASHILEHFKYPEAAIFLDECFRLVKQGGYVIIRSPLLHSRFYDDIDHVRPYPPESIFNYFFNDQQQRVGNSNIKVIKVWYRKSEVCIGKSFIVNFLLKMSWLFLRLPRSRANGYVLIIQKI